MKIFIERQDKNVEKKFTGTVSTLLDALKINPETVLVSKNGTIVTEDEPLEDSDDIRILSVISGG